MSTGVLMTTTAGALEMTSMLNWLSVLFKYLNFLVMIWPLTHLSSPLSLIAT